MSKLERTGATVEVRCMECGREVAAGTFGRCAACGGILRPEYLDNAVARLAAIEPGPGIDRYWPVLPTTAALPDAG